MKRDDKQTLLSLDNAQLNKKLAELAKEFIKARQERLLQDKSQTNVRQAYSLRKQMKMIKAELRRRELSPSKEQQE
jgi:uncharacterized protein involved in exopolysaccharide biosynthesis